MELCLMIEGQEGVTWPQWVALARACEQHGIPSLFRSDHYMNLDGQHLERGSLDAWGTLCGLAAETSITMACSGCLLRVVISGALTGGNARSSMGLRRRAPTARKAGHSINFPDRS